MFIDILLGLCALVTFAILVTGAWHLLLGVPFVPTPLWLVRQMIFVADLRGTETVYDLGAGDGRLLIEAKRRHPGIRAVGWEVVPTVWLLGRLRILLSGQNVQLRLGNLFRQDLSGADILFLYLTPGMLARLAPHLGVSLKPGALVVMHTFTFPGLRPHIIYGARDKMIFVYRSEDIRDRSVTMTSAT